MHAIFLMYGKYELVENLIRDMRSQKLPLRFYKEGEPDKSYWMDCQLRMLPFGFYDFVFPKEHMDKVLTTLHFHDKTAVYDLDFNKSYFGIKPFNLIKQFLKIEDTPEFNTSEKLLWTQQWVTIVPIGIKYDGEITEPPGTLDAGWTHERI